MPARSPLALIKKTCSSWMNDNALRLAAALAFYTVWSIGPLLLVVISVAGLALGQEAARGEVVGALRGLVGEQGASSIQDAIVNANATGNTLVANVIGIVTLLVGASGVFGELQSALNLVWDVTPKPGSFFLTIKQRFLSLTMVLGTGFLLLVTLLLSTAVGAIGTHIRASTPGLEGVMHVAQLAASFGVTALLFTLMFKVIPDAHIAWKDVWLGGAITAVLFTIGQLVIGLYLGKTSVGTAYGSASSLMVVLVWIYFSSCILFLGAEFTQAYADMYGSRVKPSKNALEVPEGTTPESAAAAWQQRQTGALEPDDDSGPNPSSHGDER